ncbi:MAG: hypothetical protein AAGG99_09095, partial [Pseudomonadota bacterium]
MFINCEDEPTTGSASDDPDKPRRLRPWQMRNNVACSVVGTCLSDGDLEKILKRLRLAKAADLPPYDLHGYFVQAMLTDNKTARAVQKVLDRRHAGVLSRVGATHTMEELRQLWRTEYDRGRIPGIYWAMQTYSHIPQELHVQVFGEVHMLSHLLGRAVHADIEQVDALRTRVTDLESMMERVRARHAERLATKERQIAELERKFLEHAAASQANTQASARDSQSRDRVAADKQTRALLTARGRARSAEARTDELSAEVKRLRATVRELEQLRTSFDGTDER